MIPTKERTRMARRQSHDHSAFACPCGRKAHLRTANGRARYCSTTCVQVYKEKA